MLIFPFTHSLSQRAHRMRWFDFSTTFNYKKKFTLALLPKSLIRPSRDFMLWRRWWVIRCDAISFEIRPWRCGRDSMNDMIIMQWLFSFCSCRCRWYRRHLGRRMLQRQMAARLPNQTASQGHRRLSIRIRSHIWTPHQWPNGSHRIQRCLPGHRMESRRGTIHSYTWC